MNLGMCPVCGRNADTGPEGTRDAFYVRCPRCGSFILSGTAAAMLPSRLENNPLAAARASHAIRSQTSEDNWLEIYSTHVDEICTKPLPFPDVQLANLLRYLKKQVGDASLTWIDITDKNALLAVVGTLDEYSLINLIEWACQQGFVTLSTDKNTIAMTPAAYEAETPTPRSPTETKSLGSTPGIRKGHCPECGPDRNADIVASHEERYDSVEMCASDSYYILRCRGCQAVYVLKEYESWEDISYEHDLETGQILPKPETRVTYWPSAAKRKRPEWLYELRDPVLSDILHEVYEALNADHHTLAAIGIRTALDRAFVSLGVEESSPFYKKLNELVEKGIINENEKSLLETLTDAGSAAAHRGWKPEPEQLTTLIDAMETFLKRVFVTETEVKTIKEDIPPRPKRQKKPKPQSGG